jgi:hypothetical protein
MKKVWALVDFGDVVVGSPFDTKEQAESCRDGMSYLGEMLEVREIDYNDEPLDSEGSEVYNRLLDAYIGFHNFHMSKTVGFYNLNLKERYRLILNMLTKE